MEIFTSSERLYKRAQTITAIELNGAEHSQNPPRKNYSISGPLTTRSMIWTSKDNWIDFTVIEFHVFLCCFVVFVLRFLPGFACLPVLLLDDPNAYPIFASLFHPFPNSANLLKPIVNPVRYISISKRSQEGGKQQTPLLPLLAAPFGFP